MCRYANKRYKVHFACFDCRKAFKKPPAEDLAMSNGEWEDYKSAFWFYYSGKGKKFRKENPEKFSYLTDKYRNRKEKCPDCGNLMANLGLDFKAPKKDKVKEWEIIRGMYRVGHNFHTCGCNGIGFVPQKKEDYIQYLQQNRDYFLGCLTRRDSPMYQENPKEYLGRFQELVQLIDRELEVAQKSL